MKIKDILNEATHSAGTKVYWTHTSGRVSTEKDGVVTGNSDGHSEGYRNVKDRHGLTHLVHISKLKTQAEKDREEQRRYNNQDDED